MGSGYRKKRKEKKNLLTELRPDFSAGGRSRSGVRLGEIGGQGGIRLREIGEQGGIRLGMESSVGFAGVGWWAWWVSQEWAGGQPALVWPEAERRWRGCREEAERRWVWVLPMFETQTTSLTVSYTHLTLPTNREV